MKQFDWEKFKNIRNNIVVHCKTEEEAKDFCNQMHKHGLKWHSGRTYIEYTRYGLYSNDTCYYGNGECSDLECAKRNGYTILEWSDYMQREFTKSDLKDGMVLYFDDGVKAVLISDYYTKRDDFEFVNGRLLFKKPRKDVTKIEYGEKVVWEPQTKRMTAEEMSQKLEELTGEKIAIEPSRNEMIGKINAYCSERLTCNGCVLRYVKRCDFWKFDSKTLQQCYEKVMEDE